MSSTQTGRMPRPFEVLLATVMPLAGFAALPATAAGQAQGFGTGPNTNVVTSAAGEPMGCDSIRMTTLQNTPGRKDIFEQYHYSNSSRESGPLAIGTPINIARGQAKWLEPPFNGGTGAAPSDGKDHLTLEIDAQSPTSYSPLRGSPTVFIEFAPNLELDGGGQTYTGRVVDPTPLIVPYHHRAGYDCSQAAAAVAPTPSSPAPAPGPAPTAPVSNPTGPSVAIYWTDHNNQNVAGASQSLAAGAPIRLTQGCGPAPDGASPARADWTTARNLTGGFEGSDERGGVKDVDLNHPAITVYGAFPGGHPVVRLTCTDAKGRANSADTHFGITGPVLKQDGVQPEPGQAPIVKVETDIGNVGPNMVPFPTGNGAAALRLEFGLTGYAKEVGTQQYFGIVLTAIPQETLPSGSKLEWIQVLSKDHQQVTSKNGQIQNLDHGAGLDGGVPYAGGQQLHDTPGELLNDSLIRDERDFYATSYLMWQASPESTRVPIGVVRWQWAGAIDRVPAPAGNYFSGWSLEPGSGTSKIESITPAQKLSDFPRWNGNNNPNNSPR